MAPILFCSVSEFTKLDEGLANENVSLMLCPELEMIPGEEVVFNMQYWDNIKAGTDMVSRLLYD